MSHKKGFTLLEILLVVGIIAILAGIVIVAINPARQLAQTRNAERRSDLKQLYSAMNQYYIDYGHYPATSTLDFTLKEVCDTGTLSSPSGFPCIGLIDLSELVPTYITAIPKDPTGPLASLPFIETAYAALGGTGYTIAKDSGNKIVMVAPNTEVGAMIAIGTSTPVSSTPDTTFTVIFNVDGGLSVPPPISDIPYGTTVTLPEDPPRDGYTFGGWYTQTNGQGDQFTASTPVVGNITVYAKWVVQVTTLYFKNAVDTNWSTLGNWFTNSTGTIPYAGVNAPWTVNDVAKTYNLALATGVIATPIITDITIGNGFTITGNCNINNIYVRPTTWGPDFGIAGGVWGGTINVEWNSNGEYGPYGLIKAGIFNGRINNEGEIWGGTFNGSVYNVNNHTGGSGMITGGNFNSNVDNRLYGQISGTAFFFGPVDNSDNGTIYNGNFCQTQEETSGYIESGTFSLGFTDSRCSNYPLDVCDYTPMTGTVCGDGTVYVSPTLRTTPNDAGEFAQADCSQCGGDGTHYSQCFFYELDEYGQQILNGSTWACPENVSNPANLACENSTANTHSDWRLPSIGELGELYSNKDVIGNFFGYYYWSSTGGDNSSQAWSKDFNDGYEYYYGPLKESTLSVRCVR